MCPSADNGQRRRDRQRFDYPVSPPPDSLRVSLSSVCGPLPQSHQASDILVISLSASTARGSYPPQPFNKITFTADKCVSWCLCVCGWELCNTDQSVEEEGHMFGSGQKHMNALWHRSNARDELLRVFEENAAPSLLV